MGSQELQKNSDEPEKQDNLPVQPDVETISSAITNAQPFIYHDYLDRLDTLEVKQTDSVTRNTIFEKCGRLFHLTRLVTDKEENHLDKLITVVNAIIPSGCTLVVIIDSDGKKVNYYIGTLAKHARNKNIRDKSIQDAGAEALRTAFEGNFYGSDLVEVENQNKSEVINQSLNKEKICSIASISGIVSQRNKEERSIDSYVQGLENLTNALREKKYTIIMIADPIQSEELHSVKRAYEELYSELSLFEDCTLTESKSESYSLSETMTKSITEGISKSISKSQFKSKSRSHSKSDSIGGSTGVSVGFFVTGSASVTYNHTEADQETTAEGDGTTETDAEQKTAGLSLANQNTHSVQTGKSVQLTAKNRAIKGLLDDTDLYINRINTAQNFGAFNCATYVLSEKKETALNVSGHYLALMRGDDSYVQVSHVNKWIRDEDDQNKNENFNNIYDHIKHFTHPVFLLKKGNDKDSKDIPEVTPASLINGKELAIQLLLPKKSIQGLSVMEMTPFGCNVPIGGDKGCISLGKLYHKGMIEDNTEIRLDLQNLTAHTFIAGSTKSGKSHTIYHLLNELDKKGIPFLVIEPAKGEYKNVFWNALVLGTNKNESDLLRLNPFAFPTNGRVTVCEHIERIVELFGTCWPLYGPMPVILRDAIEKAYQKKGWDITESKNDKIKFPTFSDVLESINELMENKGYSDDTKKDFGEGLKTRVASLNTVTCKEILCEKEISRNVLFNQNVIVDLSDIGSEQVRAFIMGILVLKLQQHRKATAVKSNADIEHVTVLEEAHRLLRRTSFNQNQESSNIMGASVRMISESIAEMRTYGEGFIIADQSPGLLDESVIRNTNTKIIMKLPYEEDRVLTGKSMGLNDKQIDEISRFQTQIAAVYQAEWPEAVLCRIADFSITDYKSGMRKFAELLIYGQRDNTAEELDDKEKENMDNEMRLLKQWQKSIACSDRLKDPRIVERVNDVIQGKRLSYPVSCNLLYILFNGKSVTRFIRLEDADEAISKINESIIEKFNFDESKDENKKCEYEQTIKEIRNRLLNCLYKIEYTDNEPGLSEKEKERVEFILQGNADVEII